MMKFAVTFVTLIAMAMALPAPQAPGVVPIITSTIERDAHNQFGLSYSTGTGIAVAQQGALKPVQTERGLDNVLVQQGTYAYTGPDGRVYKTSYIADELGFRAVGDHLPTPPPAPVVI